MAQDLGCGDSFDDLLVEARAGSPSACQRLYTANAGRVYGYLRAHGSRDPEDLTSEVFLRVFTHFDEFVGDEIGFRGWIFTIARRLLIDAHRRDDRRPTTVEFNDEVPEAASAGDTESEALLRIEDEDVAEILAHLTPDQRDVIVLRIVADLPTEQVAHMLGRTTSTVKALQRRGIASLRRRLGKARS
ncbi:MAG TPA: sigma-70 family RNA polymerase sigma factor [Acidimicrobiia bacterium]